jgi:hypothetical protein
MRFLHENDQRSAVQYLQLRMFTLQTNITNILKY